MRSDERPGSDILGGRIAPERWVPEARAKLEGRFEGLVLYLFAVLPILMGLIALGRGQTEMLIVDVVSAALIVFGAHSIRSGRRAERAFKARRVA